MPTLGTGRDVGPGESPEAPMRVSTESSGLRCVGQGEQEVQAIANEATLGAGRTLPEGTSGRTILLRPPECGLTPELSRAAQGREAHGKLYLPCGSRPEAASA